MLVCKDSGTSVYSGIGPFVILSVSCSAILSDSDLLVPGRKLKSWLAGTPKKVCQEEFGFLNYCDCNIRLYYLFGYRCTLALGDITTS
jgi:hypothetical protein